MLRRSRIGIFVALSGCVAMTALMASPSGADTITITGQSTGGDSIAVASANGGSGGSIFLNIRPEAISGASGSVTAQSSATNTGNTGPASSTSISSPVAISGNSGSTGGTGDVHSSADVTNTAIKGSASADPAAVSGDSGNSGRTGTAVAVGSAVSNANSG